jgi:predicted RNA-binding Zn-ribbon protein involved in translation (DUF1610 family)
MLFLGINMSYKLLECEQCKNLVSVENDEEKLTYICPACGTINDRTTVIRCKGFIEVTSPEIICKMDKEMQLEELYVEDMDDDLPMALNILLKFGWAIKFKGNRL